MPFCSRGLWGYGGAACPSGPLRALVGVLTAPVAIAWDGTTRTVRLTHIAVKPDDDAWYQMEPRHETVDWLPDGLDLPSVL